MGLGRYRKDGVILAPDSFFTFSTPFFFVPLKQNKTKQETANQISGVKTEFLGPWLGCSVG